MLAAEGDQKCGLTDVSYFVCGGWLACRRRAGILTVYTQSCRDMSHYEWCEKEERSVQTGLVLATGRDQKVRTDICVRF